MQTENGFIIFDAEMSNPNGDPNNDNRPRQLPDGRGFVTDVCLKRKIRNKLSDLGHRLLVEKDSILNNTFEALDPAAWKTSQDKKAKDKHKGSKATIVQELAKTYMDARFFGSVVAKIGEQVTGPIQLSHAVSVHPIEVQSIPLTRMCGQDESEKNNKTMGRKYVAVYGLYVAQVRMNLRIANKLGLTAEDRELFWSLLPALFEGDATAARTLMDVRKVVRVRQNNNGRPFRPLLDQILKIDASTDRPTKFSDYSISISNPDAANIVIDELL